MAAVQMPTSSTDTTGVCTQFTVTGLSDSTSKGASASTPPPLLRPPPPVLATPPTAWVTAAAMAAQYSDASCVKTTTGHSGRRRNASTAWKRGSPRGCPPSPPPPPPPSPSPLPPRALPPCRPRPRDRRAARGRDHPCGQAGPVSHPRRPTRRRWPLTPTRRARWRATTAENDGCRLGGSRCK